ncbi:MAG TPA: hypothetical protein VFW53_00025 [Gallionella sp.]|nr:hypothetical protein [Gallionella sp.]
MAKPNYTFEKRQKELAKKQKQEQKRLKKATAQDDAHRDDTPQPPAEVATDA